MSEAHPIACTLNAHELSRRLAEIEAVGAGSLLAVEGDAAAPVLRFRPDATTRERLEAIVAAESRCCSFLDLRLTEDAGALTLTISGLELGRSAVDDLVAAFEGRH